MRNCNDTPCKECPFRKNSAPGYLGSWDGPEQVHRYVMDEQPFPCHLTMGTPLEQHCAGAVQYLNKNAKVAKYNPEVKRQQERMKGIPTAHILNQREFVEHHSQGWREALRNPPDED